MCIACGFCDQRLHSQTHHFTSPFILYVYVGALYIAI